MSNNAATDRELYERRLAAIRETIVGAARRNGAEGVLRAEAQARGLRSAGELVAGWLDEASAAGSHPGGHPNGANVRPSTRPDARPGNRAADADDIEDDPPNRKCECQCRSCQVQQCSGCTNADCSDETCRASGCPNQAAGAGAVDDEEDDERKKFDDDDEDDD